MSLVAKFVVSIFVLCLLGSGACTKKKSGNVETTTTKASAQDAKEKNTMTIEVNGGEIKVEFYPEDAPKTVARIKELVEQGFYNGLTFHRVVPGFVVQGGDPKGNGTGGSGQNLPAEFNSRKHVEGTVAMARSADPNSADSQFYISLGTHPHLDNSYTVFGQVTSGMDVVKNIKQGDKMTKVALN